MLGISKKTAYCQNIKKNIKTGFSEAIQQYETGNYEKSEAILLILYKKINPEDTISRIGINNLLGIINKNFGNNKEAINYYFENIKLISEKNQLNTKKLSKTLNNIGNIYLQTGQYSKAVKYYNEGINIIINSNLSKLEKDKLNAVKYYNLAIVYYNIKEYG